MRRLLLCQVTRESTGDRDALGFPPFVKFLSGGAVSLEHGFDFGRAVQLVYLAGVVSTHNQMQNSAPAIMEQALHVICEHTAHCQTRLTLTQTS